MTAGRSVNSSRNDWGTPHHYVDAVKEVFGGAISLDPCASDHSVVGAAREYRIPTHDGLVESWDFPTIYCNPPYGADRDRGTTIRDWLRRCADAHRRHRSDVIALVPVATNTRHWKVHIWGAATCVAFLYDTRLRFLVEGRDEGKGAPMACAMVYWGGNSPKFTEVFLRYGAVVDLRSLHGVDVGRAHDPQAQLLVRHG